MSGPGWLWVPGPAGPPGRPEHAPPPQNSGAGGKPLQSCFLLPRLHRGQAPEALLSGLHMDLPPGERLFPGSGPDQRWDSRLFIAFISFQRQKTTSFLYIPSFCFLCEGFTFDWTSAIVTVGKLKGIPDPLMGTENNASSFPAAAYNYYVTYNFLTHQMPAATVARPAQTLSLHGYCAIATYTRGKGNAGLSFLSFLFTDIRWNLRQQPKTT